MWGPYREVLLQAGALEVLLEAALAPTQDDNCRKVIEKAAAVGIMYLCTVVRQSSDGPIKSSWHHVPLHGVQPTKQQVNQVLLASRTFALW